MRHFETREVTVTQEVELPPTCDGCGISAEDTEFGTLVEVAIEVNLGEEGGRRDELHYCDPCLVARVDAFVTAGSRAPYVTGVEVEVEEEL